MESVATLIAGGVAFSTSNSSSGPQAKAQSVFNLYRHESDEAVAEEVAFYVPMKLYFRDGVSGLLAGAPVEYKGLRLGTVEKVSAELSEDKTQMLTFASIRIEPDRLPANIPHRDDNAELRAKRVYEFLEFLVKQDVRAQLKTVSLLTGKALVQFAHFPGSKPESIKYVDGVGVFPTVPGSLVGVMQKVDGIVTRVNEILAKIDAIPITEIGDNLAQVTATLNKVPIKEIGDNLAVATAKIDAIPMTRLSNDLAKTLQSITALVQSLNAAKGGVLGIQTRDAIAEISRAASALRGMAEYLERHPEALLKGRKN
jgi:paraquat-inducible protein B